MIIRRIAPIIFTSLFALASFSACGAGSENPSSSNPTSEQKTSIDSSSSSSSGTSSSKAPVIKKGSKTLFIYMCGSNLESKQGAASKNIDELLSANVGDNTQIVIQTGGSKSWKKHGISTTNGERYVANNGRLELVSSFANQNMGASSTLKDFLIWGQSNYLSETNMLILWDHGGGSAKGVCFDENYDFDSLTLPELKTALKEANLRRNFDIIGFDACLMAGVETANCIKDYARYMIASEEIVPQGGWDYKSVVEAIDTSDDLVEIGEIVCESFMEKCEESGTVDNSTLSLINLSKLDPITEHLDNLGKELMTLVGSGYTFSTIIAASKRCEKFGYDDVFLGSSNMVDYMDFATDIYKNDFMKFIEVIDVVEEAVVGCVSGRNRENGGLSLYFPIDYNQEEIANYIALGISENYNNFLSTYYLDVPETTISFSNNGSSTDEGAFEVALSPESKKYLSSMTYYLIEKDNKGVDHILYSDYDMDSDWDSLVFTSSFKGIRRLYNGHPLYSTPFYISDNFVEYLAPIAIDGKRGNMRYYHYPEAEADKQFDVPRSKPSSRESLLPNQPTNPWEGDNVQLGESIKIVDGIEVIEYGETFVLPELDFDDLYKEITEVPLSGTTYYYVFVATDIFGNEFYSDMATLTMDYTYEQLLNNPLPEGSYAATVTNITSYER